MNFQTLSNILVSITGKSTVGLIITGIMMALITIFYIIFKISSKPTQAEVGESGTGSVIDEQNQANNDIQNSQEHFNDKKINK